MSITWKEARRVMKQWPGRFVFQWNDGQSWHDANIDYPLPPFVNTEFRLRPIAPDGVEVPPEEYWGRRPIYIGKGAKGSRESFFGLAFFCGDWSEDNSWCGSSRFIHYWVYADDPSAERLVAEYDARKAEDASYKPTEQPKPKRNRIVIPAGVQLEIRAEGGATVIEWGE